RLVGAPFLVEPLQPLDRAPLRRIGDESALGEALLVECDDILGHGTLVIRSCAERSSRVRSMIGCSRVVSMAMRSSCIASQAMLPAARSPLRSESGCSLTVGYSIGLRLQPAIASATRMKRRRVIC